MDPLRKSLIRLIQKSNCTQKYKAYIIDLKNKSFTIDQRQEIKDIGDLFVEIVENGDEGILHELANESCKVGVRSLLQEINESDLNELQKQYDALKTTKQTLQKYNCRSKQQSQVNLSNFHSVNNK